MINRIIIRNLLYLLISFFLYIVILLLFSIPDWDGTIIDTKENNNIGIIYFFFFLFFIVLFTIFIILEAKKINKSFFIKYSIFILIAILLAILPTFLVASIGDFRLGFTSFEVENGDANLEITFLVFAYLLFSFSVFFGLVYSINLIFTIFRYYNDEKLEFINKNVWFLLFYKLKANIDNDNIIIENKNYHFIILLYKLEKDKVNDKLFIQFTQKIVKSNNNDDKNNNDVYDLIDEFINNEPKKEQVEYETLKANDLGSKIELQKKQYSGDKIIYNFFIIPNIITDYQINGELNNFFMIYNRDFRKKIKNIIKNKNLSESN